MHAETQTTKLFSIQTVKTDGRTPFIYTATHPFGSYLIMLLSQVTAAKTLHPLTTRHKGAFTSH